MTNRDSGRGVLFKISNEYPSHFYRGDPPPRIIHVHKVSSKGQLP